MSEAMTAIGTIGDLVMGYKNAEQQSSIQHRMLSNANQSINPAAYELVRQTVEAQQAGATGSATPALIGMNEAMADYQIQADQRARQLDALKAAGGMQSPTGNAFSQILAALTGGLGGSYALAQNILGTGSQGTIFGPDYLPSGAGMMMPDYSQGIASAGYPQPFTGGYGNPELSTIFSGNIPTLSGG